MNIRNTLKRIPFFQKIKFLLQKAEFHFYRNSIQNNPNWHLLWKYSVIAKSRNNHRFYEKVLSAYDEIDFSTITGFTFLDNGAGTNSLNSYRGVIVNLDGSNFKCFEKVYLANTFQIERTIWFYEEIFPLIEDHLSVPKLRMVKGDKIKVVYFDWIDKVPNTTHSELDIIQFYFDNIFSVFKNLEIQNGVKGDFANFVKDESFKVSFRSALNWVESHFGYSGREVLKTALKLLEDEKRFKKILTHGDIGPSNIINNRFVIDFDSFGFYPEGFEYAVILCKSYKIHSIQDFNNYIEQYRTRSKSKILLLPFIFFSFIFYCGGRAILLEVELTKMLFKRLLEEVNLYIGDIEID